MSWISKLFYGVDLDEAQAREDDLNRQLEAENVRAAAKYREEYGDDFADDYFQAAEEHRTASWIQDVHGEVSDAFDEGLAEGADNIRGTVGSTINRTLGSVFGIIPWQVWIGLAIFAAFQLGLFKRK